jgi:hypothetical protein
MPVTSGDPDQCYTLSTIVCIVVHTAPSNLIFVKKSILKCLRKVLIGDEPCSDITADTYSATRVNYFPSNSYRRMRSSSVIRPIATKAL